MSINVSRVRCPWKVLGGQGSGGERRKSRGGIGSRYGEALFESGAPAVPRGQSGYIVH